MKERVILKLPKHCNPIPKRTASAPYNFVPLPETVVLAVNDAKNLPDHDRYEHYSGYFDVVLTTKSPLYIRCPFTVDDFMKMDQQDNLPFREQVKNTPHFFYTRDQSKPVIPGSSLRGMLRNLLEIVSYSKINKVTDSKIFYRVVAVGNDDPLKKPYNDIIKYEKVGYLMKKRDGWYVKPAKKPADIGWPEDRPFIKVKATNILKKKIKGFVDFNAPGYRPQYHEVMFDIKVGKDGRKYPEISSKDSTEHTYPYKGYLICSGNMIESSDGGGKSPRKYCILVLERDEKAKEIKINKQSIRDYLNSLTPFQKEEPFDEKMGCLIENRPIFYVERDNEVLFFGHCPNFRVPAFDEIKKEANSPLDFVPEQLRSSDDIDYAEAIFGFVRNDNGVGGKKQAYASRVFVTDAVLEEGHNDIWLSKDPIVPKILASPKPTTFSHYLVQPYCEKRLLKHYGSKNETVIRGFKRYWLQGERNKNHIIENDPQWLEADGQVKKDSKQHTQIKPIKPGIRFRFRIYFENLSERELGALCWILNPLGDPKKEYCHQLGMGKPLGMGAVKLEATLYTIDRKKRYSTLFNESKWETGISNGGQNLSDHQTLEKLTSEFEKHILSQLNLSHECKHLSELKRIAMLLKMMEWPGFPPKPDKGLYLEEDKRPNTRYMRIKEEYKGIKVFPYKDRNVLPDPSAFGKLTGNIEP
ncbi:TIGR03986 family CRISPR-associated RAMP protein [Tepidanaerobacter sp. GT38]|uniref:TIGR03986 family type III CRISPR-associated RAMP protein n=1 Tax=Tepidanaerobacter sp. GT38 TaxID=2722793 RepID=UPI001F18A0D4|nr:TIGR03986 family CRISPR-associated RAMP protein [Tepidanaerobacter sp. GT38]MCG1012276.1 TIGR03986 family CRISPR-associated RAMP protein [Tepidanaerobacter sp. GT38]